MKKKLVLVAMVSALFVNSYGMQEDRRNDRDIPPTTTVSASPVMAQVPQERKSEGHRRSKLKSLGITAVCVGTGVALLYAGHLLLHVIEMNKFRNMLGDTPWFLQ